jgi:hypothetical protein
VTAALHGAKRNGIDHQPRLEARLDLEKPGDLAEHCDSLTVQRGSGGFEPQIP